MSEQSEEKQAQRPADESWQEVGRQFQALGESLSTALRTAWQSEQNRQRMQEMQTGLQSFVTQVESAVRESTSTPEAQDAIRKAKAVGETTVQAAEQALQDARPHILSALQQVNVELQKMIDQMQEKPPTGRGADPAAGE